MPNAFPRAEFIDIPLVNGGIKHLSPSGNGVGNDLVRSEVKLTKNMLSEIIFNFRYLIRFPLKVPSQQGDFFRQDIQYWIMDRSLLRNEPHNHACGEMQCLFQT